MDRHRFEPTDSSHGYRQQLCLCVLQKVRFSKRRTLGKRKEWLSCSKTFCLAHGAYQTSCRLLLCRRCLMDIPSLALSVSEIPSHCRVVFSSSHLGEGRRTCQCLS